MNTKRVIFVGFALMACISAQAQKPPIIDDSQWTPEQKATYPAALAACQKIADGATTELEEYAALYDKTKQAFLTEKRNAVRRACLQARGFTILY